MIAGLRRREAVVAAVGALSLLLLAAWGAWRAPAANPEAVGNPPTPASPSPGAATSSAFPREALDACLAKHPTARWTLWTVGDAVGFACDPFREAVGVFPPAPPFRKGPRG